jgi:hypothetical protein
MLSQYKAVYEKKEQYGLFQQDDLNWQAQWYYGHSINTDKYERGGWYRTEKEALEAAKQGKEIFDLFEKPFNRERKTMQVIYRIDIEGSAQLQNDVEGASELVKTGAADFGYATAEFSVEIDGNQVEILVLTPDTMLSDQRNEIETLVRKYYSVLLKTKLVYL